jgi:signal transduction histidine kinase
MVKRICEISNLILKCSSANLKRLDFIKGISEIFFDFCRADSIILFRGDRERLNCFTYKLPDSFSHKALQPCDFPTHYFSEKILSDKFTDDFIHWMNSFFLHHVLRLKSVKTNKRFLQTVSGDEGICFYAPNLSLKDILSKSTDDHKKCYYLIPFLIDNENYAILTLVASHANGFTHGDISFLSKLNQVLSDAFAHQFAQDALKERVKELSCLYQITQVANKPSYSISQLMHRIAELLPSAMQYPEIASTRIVVDGEEYWSHNFHESKVKLSMPISTRYEQRGLLEVFYDEKDLPHIGQIFLQEESNLLEAVSKHIALIVEQKQIEEMNIRLQEQLRHADRLATIGQLSAGIAHEINEPLATILGFAQLIETDETTPPQLTEDVKKIINATLHGREIVRKLMLFSRQMPPKKGHLKINEIIEEGLYFLESRCKKSGIEIRRSLAPNLPEIDADPNQIHQVLVNLIVNAIHAMPEGGKLILSTRLNNDKTLSFFVEDTGEGMPEEIQQKVFIPFFTTKDINQGTGLGLSVVHGIVTSHGGDIIVKSELNKGSSFEIRLPYLTHEK